MRRVAVVIVIHITTLHVVEYLSTHREFLFLLPVLSVGWWLGTASIHSVVRIIICQERAGRSNYIYSIPTNHTVNHAESKSNEQTYLHQAPLPLHSGLLRACKNKMSAHLETRLV